MAARIYPAIPLVSTQIETLNSFLIVWHSQNKYARVVEKILPYADGERTHSVCLLSSADRFNIQDSIHFRLTTFVHIWI